MSDVERRNTIANLLQDWGLLKVSNPAQAERVTSLSQIKIVAFKEKNDWNLVAKYSIGTKKSNH